MGRKIIIAILFFFITGCGKAEEIDYSVKDTSPPKIQCKNGDVEQNGEFIINNFCEVSDDSNEELEILFYGNTNTSIVGKRKIYVSTTDSEGNIGINDFVLNIIAKEETEGEEPIEEIEEPEKAEEPKSEETNEPQPTIDSNTKLQNDCRNSGGSWSNGTCVWPTPAPQATPESTPIYVPQNVVREYPGYQYGGLDDAFNACVATCQSMTQACSCEPNANYDGYVLNY